LHTEVEGTIGRFADERLQTVLRWPEAVEQAAELDIEPGSPVLLTVNRWIDTDGAVIEYGESVSSPGRWTLYEYDVEVDQ
jgi:DNA-binding GntR family transcriptional regulator